jgi:hypothetical protein
MFVDGQQRGVSINFFSTSSAAMYITNKLYIGKHSTSLVGDTWSGDLDEIRVTRGVARWTSQFTSPTTLSVADDEIYRSFKLMPGVVFERLYEAGTGVTELNVFWSGTDPLHQIYVNGTKEITGTITINHAGVEGSGNALDAPMTIKTHPYGALEQIGF